MRLKAVFVAVMRHFREEYMWRSAYHRLDERAQAIAPTLPVIASDLALYVPQDGNLNSLGVLVLTPRELAFARPHPEAYRDTQAFTRRHVFPLEELEHIGVRRGSIYGWFARGRWRDSIVITLTSGAAGRFGVESPHEWASLIEGQARIPGPR